VIARAKSRGLTDGDEELRFDYSGHAGKISIVESLLGRRGVLRLDSLTVETLGQSEDHLLLIALTDDGQAVDPAVTARLLTIPVYTSGPDRPDGARR